MGFEVPNLTSEELEQRHIQRWKRVTESGLRYEWKAWEEKLERLNDIDFVVALGYTLKQLQKIAEEYRMFERYVNNKLELTDTDKAIGKACNEYIKGVQTIAGQVKSLKSNSTIGRMISYE